MDACECVRATAWHVFANECACVREWLQQRNDSANHLPSMSPVGSGGNPTVVYLYVGKHETVGIIGLKESEEEKENSPTYFELVRMIL